MAIRFCKLDTTFLKKEDCTTEAMCKALSGTGNQMVIAVDEQSRYLGHAGKSSDCSHIVLKRLCVYLDESVFLAAHDLVFQEENEEYLPVLKRDGTLLCFCYNDASIEKTYEYVLEMIVFNEVNSFSDVISKDAFIRIWGFNEIGYYLHILLERQGVPHGVYGPCWSYLVPALTGIPSPEGETLDILVEGNYGLPLEEGAYGKIDLEWHDIYYADITRYYHVNTISWNNVLSEGEFQERVCEDLDVPGGLMMARLGNTELWVLKEYLEKQEGLKSHYSKFWMFYLFCCTGFFSNPSNETVEEDIDRYVDLTINAIRNCDYHAYWGDENVAEGLRLVLRRYASGASVMIPWESLNTPRCCYSRKHMRNILEGKRVLVVSPFSQTIRSQLGRREFLYPPDHRFPDCSLTIYRAPETQMGCTAGYKNWFDAFEHVTDDIAGLDFDIALIGAGCYGYPLASRIKEMGKKSISLSSYLANWFGIKMKRYCAYAEVNRFWNNNWTFPTETPPDGYENIENGCYWR